MPNENIERTIYRLELDGSGYIAGVDKLSASTSKLTAEQEKANAELKKNEAALKANVAVIEKTKQAIEDMSKSMDRKFGDDVRLQTSLKRSQEEQQRLIDVVNKSKQAYDLASKAAQDFAVTSTKAANLQAQTTGGKIPTSAPIGISAGITSQIAGVLNVADFTKQLQVIEQTKNEFDDLRVSIGLADARMKQLNATDEEFKLLAPIVAKGKEAIDQYEKATQGAEVASGTLRTQLRAGREELVKLEQAGKGATTQYFELEKRVARLTDQFGDQQQRIRILASDTKLLDFGKGAITAATSAFQVYTAISILAGDESAELQKKTMQLFAAMQLLQSLEQLSNLTRREGILSTLTMSGAQSVYTAVVGASTGALKAFKIALAATGIGAAIVLIGFLVSKYIDYRNAVKEAGAQQKVLREITEAAIKDFTAEAVHLDLIKSKLADLNIPQEKRIALAKEYNKTAEEGNQIDLKQIDNIDLLNKAIDKQIERIKARALAKASENIITQRAETLLLAQEKARVTAEGIRAAEEKFLASHPATLKSDKNLKNVIAKQIADAIQQATPEGIANDPDVKKAQKDLDVALAASRGLINIDDLLKQPKEEKIKTDKAAKKIQNDFERKKAELDARLAALNAKEADDESKIRIEFAARLSKEQLEITKNKNLTKPQKNILNAELVTINKIELDKAIEDFRKKVTDARQKINDELLTLQNKNTQDTLNLIQDEFDRRAELINFNEQNELETSKANTQKRLEALDLQRLLIGEKAYQDAKAVIIAAGEQNGLNITRRFAEQRQVLAFDMIEKLGDNANKLLESQNLGLSRLSVIAIDQQNELLQTGKISFEDYQKAITKIGKDEGEKRVENEKKSLRAQINLFSQELVVNNGKLLEDEKTKLLDKIRELEKKLSDLEKGNVTKDDSKSKVDTFAAYAEAVGQVADSVIQFWQKANEAEAKALDRSIQLQETRVAAAQRIADRGNAQYLKQEEDRLTELNVKRENAARKQLGIDAALQASQILVGITGAVSRIAGAPFGSETIADIAIIIGALATGYGIVKSLQGNQPKLKGGTKDVRRDGHPSGVDTIPAWLNEGEAVIPTHRNKAYKPTVAAIYDGTVPAEHLNQFVKNYHRIKSVPQPNYDRIKDAAELHIGENGKMAVLLNEQNRLILENNDLQRQTLRAFKTNKVDVHYDANGLAVHQMQIIEQMRIDKYT